MIFEAFIFPIAKLIECAYLAFYEIFSSQGISIIGLSAVVSLATLPLYVVAESWQEKERDIQSKMEHGIQRIKKTFKGDERYMLLSTFYKQHKYHPIMALRSSFGLLIQIPFFLAAYSFLSNLEAIKGARFFLIENLGAPDQLIKTPIQINGGGLTRFRF